MAHVGIFGTTESGKSTLARYFLSMNSAAGRGTLVLDPVCDPAWKKAGADYVSDDPDEFLRVVKSNPNCSVYVDESGDSKKDDRIRRMASQYRHAGHNITYIGHRIIDVQPAVRTCLSAVFLFLAPKKDGQLVADDFVDNGLLQCDRLVMGEYLYKRKGAPLQKGDIFMQVYGKNKFKGGK
jgi:hypothetical protein